MIVSTSRRERDSRSSFQTTTTSPAAKLIEEPEELGTLPTSTGSLLAEDALAARRFERRHLSRRVLIVGGNAGVTDQHCIRVLQNQCVLQYRFATSKPLKTRPGPDRCKTDPLCNPGIRGVSDRIPTEGRQVSDP